MFFSGCVVMSCTESSVDPAPALTELDAAELCALLPNVLQASVPLDLPNVDVIDAL